MNDTVEQNAQTRRIAIGIVVGLLAGGAAWWFMDRNSHLPLDTVGAPSLPDVLPVPPAVADAIAHPLAPETPAADSAAAALPADPDAAAAAALDEVFGAGTLVEWLIPERLSRRLVATLDNLSRDAKTEALRPLRAPPGPVVVEREMLDATVGSEKITLSAANAARYDAPVALLARTDMGLAAQVYRRLYPHLQRAYEDLGYPGRYFNDRVVETIDHLLATPEPAGPLLLEQPKVLYRFADAGLESRSAGQKLLLRMGVEHARTVKNKLREFRAQITSKE